MSHYNKNRHYGGSCFFFLFTLRGVQRGKAML